jgi:hypothetical protein
MHNNIQNVCILVKFIQNMGKNWIIEQNHKVEYDYVASFDLNRLLIKLNLMDNIVHSYFASSHQEIIP